MENFLIAEYDYETDMRVQGQEKFEEGEERGKAEGIDLFSTLTKKLLEDNRLDELKIATEDSEYRNQLFEEYGLI